MRKCAFLLFLSALVSPAAFAAPAPLSPAEVCNSFQAFSMGPTVGVIREISRNAAMGHLDEITVAWPNGGEAVLVDGDGNFAAGDVGKSFSIQYRVDAAWYEHHEYCMPLNLVETAEPAEPAGPAGQAPAEKTFTNSIGMEFALIPAGVVNRTFINKNEFGEEEAALSKFIVSRPFYLGKTEVTQEQWVKVMGKNPSDKPGRHNPVENVSWPQAKEFTLRLNALEGLARYRLPTEMEWELAAGGGRDASFFFMRNLPEWKPNNANTYKLTNPLLARFAWFAYEDRNLDIKRPTSHQPVAQKEPNPYGLYDVYGNVAEWVLDWHDKLPQEPEMKNYVLLEQSAERVRANPTNALFKALRGGSYTSHGVECSTDYRAGKSLGNGSPTIGLRVYLSTARNPEAVPRQNLSMVYLCQYRSSTPTDVALYDNDELLASFLESHIGNPEQYALPIGAAFERQFDDGQWKLVNDLSSGALRNAEHCSLIFTGRVKNSDKQVRIVFGDITLVYRDMETFGFDQEKSSRFLHDLLRAVTVKDAGIVTPDSYFLN